MISRDPSVLLLTVCLFAGVLGRGDAAAQGASSAGGAYGDLVTFYKDFRAFQKAKLVNGVPDYTPAAMTAQAKALEGYKERLAAIDPSAWPIPQQVDYQIVRAEVNSLDFDHRVMQPWAKNPGYYVTFFPEESDQPKREGPFADGRHRALELQAAPLGGGRRESRGGPQSDSGPAGPGQGQPDRKRPRPLGLGHEEPQAAEQRARRLREDRAREPQGRASTPRGRRPTI